MRGFIGSNGTVYSSGQRMAMFSRLAGLYKMDSVHSMFAKKKEAAVVEPFIGDPSTLSDKKYDELLKSGARVIYGKKEFVPTKPRVLSKAEYDEFKRKGYIGVDAVVPRQETVETPGGLYTVYYNAMGSPYITDKKFHEVSKAYPAISSPTLKSMTILSEDFDKETGLYHAVGRKPDYSEEIYINTKAIPDYLNKEGAVSLKKMQKLLSDSEYAGKFLTIGGAEMAGDVEPLKASDASVRDIQGAVSAYVGTAPVTKKWELEKDSKKEAKMDESIKEALDEKVETSKVVDEIEKPAVLKQFTIENTQRVGDDIVRDDMEIPIPKVEQSKVEETGYIGRPSWYEYGPMVFDNSGLYDVTMSVPEIKVVDVYGQD